MNYIHVSRWVVGADLYKLAPLCLPVVTTLCCHIYICLDHVRSGVTHPK